MTCIGARMAPNLSLLVLLFLLVPGAGNAAVAAGPAGIGSAFNITEILNRYPEFKLFNFLLSKTRVAREINSRSTVTVLVPDNAAVDWLLRRSSKLARSSLFELMSVHVALDYIDEAKLAALPRNRTTTVTTLFQTSGTARNRTGFLNVTAAGPARGGAVSFVSAAPGSLVTATFKRAVTARPYNLSVLQISNFIVPPGVLTRPLPRSPRMRQMAIAPSPAPTPPPPLPPTEPSVEDDTGTEGPGAAEAPAPSHGHAVQATSLWSAIATAAVGMTCVVGYL